jgi:hypothetical protein
MAINITVRAWWIPFVSAQKGAVSAGSGGAAEYAVPICRLAHGEGIEQPHKKDTAFGPMLANTFQ